jgi:hypothetical protein
LSDDPDSHGIDRPKHCIMKRIAGDSRDFAVKLQQISGFGWGKS